MPGGYPIGPDLCNFQNITANTSTSFTVQTSSGAAATAGAWVQLSAATPYDTCWMVVMADLSSLSNYMAVHDIAIGAAGSEIILVPKLISYYPVSSAYSFPIDIPAGTRIAARATSTAATETSRVAVMLLDGGFTQMKGVAGIDAIGFNAANVYGTVIATPAAANTKGSYTQLIAATARDYIGFFWSTDSMANTSGGNPQGVLMDIAVGAGGSEVPLVTNAFCYALSNNTRVPSTYNFLPIQIPAGSRLAARIQSNLGTAQSLGLTIYGVYQ